MGVMSADLGGLASSLLSEYQLVYFGSFSHVPPFNLAGIICKQRITAKLSFLVQNWMTDHILPSIDRENRQLNLK
jgi:hypothetical protein